MSIPPTTVIGLHVYQKSVQGSKISRSSRLGVGYHTRQMFLTWDTFVSNYWQTPLYTPNIWTGQKIRTFGINAQTKVRTMQLLYTESSNELVCVKICILNYKNEHISIMYWHEASWLLNILLNIELSFIVPVNNISVMSSLPMVKDKGQWNEIVNFAKWEQIRLNSFRKSGTNMNFDVWL